MGDVSPVRTFDPERSAWRLSIRSIIVLVTTAVSVVLWGEARYRGLTSRLERIEEAGQRNWSQYQMRDFAYALERGNRDLAHADPKMEGLFVPEVQIRQPILYQSSP